MFREIAAVQKLYQEKYVQLRAACAYANKMITEFPEKEGNNELPIKESERIFKDSQKAEEIINTIIHNDNISIEKDYYLNFYENYILFYVGSNHPGNPTILALLALDFLNHQKFPGLIEIFQGGNNVFLVIDRPIGSNPLDPLTWGKALICDPTSNVIYKAKYLQDQFRVYNLQEVTEGAIPGRLAGFRRLRNSIAKGYSFNTTHTPIEPFMEGKITNHKINALYKNHRNFLVTAFNRNIAIYLRGLEELRTIINDTIEEELALGKQLDTKMLAIIHFKETIYTAKTNIQNICQSIFEKYQNNNSSHYREIFMDLRQKLLAINDDIVHLFCQYERISGTTLAPSSDDQVSPHTMRCR
jgi:hypothetical protein